MTSQITQFQQSIETCDDPVEVARKVKLAFKRMPGEIALDCSKTVAALLEFGVDPSRRNNLGLCWNDVARHAGGFTTTKHENMLYYLPSENRRNGSYRLKRQRGGRWLES